jgi:F0F1-type ATP synthase membrane subunit b/b'
MRNQADRDAQEECRNISEQWNKEIETIRERAREKVGKARQFILQALLG